MHVIISLLHHSVKKFLLNHSITLLLKSKAVCFGKNLSFSLKTNNKFYVNLPQADGRLGGGNELLEGSATVLPNLQNGKQNIAFL